MLSYCKKCGRILYGILELETTCDVCGSQTYEVPNKYIDNFRWRDGDGKKALIEELVKPSPEFDQYLFDHRDEILTQKNADFQAAMAHGKAILEEKNRVPKCPICGSTNIKKISFTSRAVKTALFGAVGAIDDAGKTWKCNNCGSRF